MNDSADLEGRLRKKVLKAIENPSYFEGMRSAFRNDVLNQERIAPMIEGLEQRKEMARRARELCMNDPSYVKKAIERLEENGIRVIVARDAQEARELVLEELEGETLLVKSKSNVTKEIGLTPYLESMGIEVIETDAGDRIVQLSGQKPVHPTGPAANFTRYEVASILENHLGKKVDPDPKSLTMAIREEIADYISRAKIGLTGANFIAAEEGAMVIVHNEGNISLCARRPTKHIVVSAMEKVVPNLVEAMNLVKLQVFYGTASLTSSFVDVIAAPSRTADIEKQLFYGMHGPKEIVLILVDSGRSIIEDREVMYCINCGACLLQCPVYDIMGSDFGGHAYLGGRGVCFSAELDGLEEGVEGGLTFCTNCGLCKEICPVKVDTPRMMRSLRKRANENGVLPLSGHEELIGNISNNGNPWAEPQNRRKEWASDLDLPKSGEVLYFAGCYSSYHANDILLATIDILRKAGVDVAYLGEDEWCCGSPVPKLGAEDLFEETARKNWELWKSRGVRKIITSCPGCFNAISSYREFIDDFDIEVEHISQTLSNLIEDGTIELEGEDISVTYHDPCDLGRHRGEYEAPRKVLRSIPGLELREMEFIKERGICCGAGSGVKKAHPDLACAIARKRLDSAESTGADYLVTACPFCRKNLEDAREEDDIVVMDLAVLVQDLLKRGKIEDVSR
ncbi:MAG: 4Fe-4S dicluster domain-containing protein [Methanomassiliicoccales archaeon]|nr:4Fe-4S dicluster domain-containing protein [Methanomassiliicoccales archaeon]